MALFQEQHAVAQHPVPEQGRGIVEHDDVQERARDDAPQATGDAPDRGILPRQAAPGARNTTA
ncbi:MAG: hypothetical protein AB7Q97_18360 [Gammaproteobacteria bacterium]